MPDVHDDAQVTFSVRELLTDLKRDQTAGFARIEVALQSKADKADLAKLEARLDSHAERLSRLEQAGRDNQVATAARDKRDETTWTTRNKVIGVLATVGLILATFLGPYLGVHLHF